MKVLREFDSFDTKLFESIRLELKNKFNSESVVCHSPFLDISFHASSNEKKTLSLTSLNRISEEGVFYEIPSELTISIDFNSVFLSDLVNVLACYQVTIMYIAKIGGSSEELRDALGKKNKGMFSFFRKPEYFKLIQGECFIFPEHSYYVLEG